MSTPTANGNDIERHRRKFNSRAALRMQSGISDDEEGPEIHMNSIIDIFANNQSQQKPSFKSEVTCYFCGIKGHYKRDCRKYQEMRSSGKYVPNNKTGNKWSQGTQTDTRESQRPDKIYEGSQLKLANDEMIKTMGQADFNIKINDKIWKQRFVIAEIDAPAIIGYNFLYSKNCQLDIRHKTIIMSKVLGDSSHLMDAMIEPIMKKDNEILVARALEDPSNGRIPLQIENTERTSRKVFKIKESKADECPEHLVTLFKNNISNLTEEQRIQMKVVLKRQTEAFANSKNELETKESNAEEEPSCYLRAVKTSEPDSTIREEIEVESTEQRVNWTQSKTTEKILSAQQQDDTIAIILKLKSEIQPNPKWEDISLESKQFKTYWAQWDSARKGPTRHPTGPMKQYLIGSPLERVAIDILGPLPETKNKNKYILVITDYFSRWAESYPMPDQEAETVTRIFVGEFIARFGLPRQVHIDQGRQFESHLFQSLCQRFKIDKTRTTALHPQNDGMVDRLNRTIEDILSKFIAKDKQD
ncbi:unnamed protein product [Mytilus coruscus]|uniref:Integrase catalytic domain-containing protein n=1 Tax=Mytilus coruscus TaxID=42192 RepID=A0A6J8DDF0_MYTCO|nr:unnamed protein product [Mytilus coruscus]